MGSLYFFPELFSPILSALLPLSVICSTSMYFGLSPPFLCFVSLAMPCFSPPSLTLACLPPLQVFLSQVAHPPIFPPPLLHLPHSPCLPSLCLYLCLSVALSTPSLCSVFLSRFFLLSGRTFLSSHTQNSH